MVCGRNWQEISVFENILKFYTSRFYLKMMKTDSSLTGASTKREISFFLKTSFFEGKRKEIQFVCIKALYGSLIRSKAHKNRSFW